MSDCTVVIVSWNCRVDLVRCLESLPLAAKAYSINTVVVDNASSDGTQDLLRWAYPRVKLMANPDNRGFAAANNQVLEIANTRYLMLLNPDTKVEAGAFDVMFRFMDQHPEAWVCGPSLRNGDGSPQHTGVQFPRLLNLLVESFFLDRVFPRSRLFGRHKEMYRDQSATRSVEYVQGACMLVRWELVKAVGLLDTDFFMYFEEVDWCYRIRQAGGKVVVVPEARVVHYGGEKLGHFDERRLVHYHDSLLRFYRKHHGPASRAALRLLLMLRSIIRIGVWGIYAGLRRDERPAAFSSMKGYLRALHMLFKGESSGRDLRADV